LTVIIILIIINFSNVVISSKQDNADNLKKLSPSNYLTKSYENRKIEKNIVSFLNNRQDVALIKDSKFKKIDSVGEKVRLEVILTNEIHLNSLIEFSNDLEVENHYKSLVQVLVPFELITELSEKDFIQYIRTPVKPKLNDVTSEGVNVIGANLLQNIGHYGAGVKVAVIDLGFSGYNTNPDLPSDRIKETISYRADKDFEWITNHGCACAEIILDVAPLADLYLYNFETISELNNAVSRAITKNVDIISFSIGYTAINNFDGVGYSGIGDVCGIVDNARSNGILFVTCTGNEADHHYEGTWTDVNSNDWHEFGPNDEELDLGYLSTDTFYYFELTWDDWPYSDQDYDLVIYDSSFNVIDWSADPQTGSEPPEDWIMGFIPYDDWYYLDILNWDATQPVNFELYGNDEIPFVEYNHPESSLTCPADAYGAMAVGATYWADDTLEEYSSRGPTNDGRTKPDITAPDWVSTWIYGTEAFGGTSASVPHVAGAAALLKSAAPSCNVNDLQNIIENAAFDLGTVGKDNLYGSGRIDIWNAYNSIKPEASFTYAPLNPSTANNIQFTDSSTDPNGNIVSWNWDFGDGGTSTTKNPSHKYSDDGTYIISLTVTDDDGITNETSKQIIVSNVGPTADFIYSPLNPTTNDTVQFTDKSFDNDGFINLWYWDFGDGNISTLQNPTHQYNDNGTYNIDLIVTDNDGATNEASMQIHIANVPPKAKFTYNPPNPTDLQTISFTDLSTDSDGSITAWQWDFGDGNTSTLQNPTHKYGDDGTYTVSLTVIDDDTATNLSEKLIHILNVPPIANFTFYPLNPCVNQTIIFTDNSIDQDGDVSQWQWDFGDGNTSTLQNPTHHYTSDDMFTITLTVTDNDVAINNISKSISVKWRPNVNFTWEPNYPLVNESLQFYDQSFDEDGYIINWTWDFGDGNISYLQNPTHIYSKENTYSVTLNVTDNSSFHGELSKNVIINMPPKANFTFYLQCKDFLDKM
jgi:PKD repeat protein